jgi:hypothetical protein
MHYTVITQGHRQFEVYDEAGSLQGTLTQNMWRPTRAEMIVHGTGYQFAPKGFWQTINMTRNDMHVAEIKFTLGGGLKIHFEHLASPYRFRHKSLWHSSYAITDDYGHEIAVVQTGINWKKLKSTYEIDVHPNTLDKEMNALLPLLILYCVRYMRVLMAAG